jgi:hypothetical protein
MNKVRILIAALGLVVVAGGTFAFRARTTNGTLFCTSVANGNTTTQPYTVSPSGNLRFCADQSGIKETEQLRVTPNP